jgi:hypothetical protein
LRGIDVQQLAHWSTRNATQLFALER